ncbi:MAG TPA: leucyl aminopeptidase, partial [Roseiflexaceae bacterium]|nr:leucyl aminopeptidase [Roseiflexaceae bacterium]
MNGGFLRAGPVCMAGMDQKNAHECAIQWSGMMEISVLSGDALQHETPLLIVGGWEDEALPAPLAGMLEEGDWRGTFKRTLVVYPRGEMPARRVLLIGLGKREQATIDRLRELAAIAAQQARELNVARATFALPVTEGLAVANIAYAIAEGVTLGLYRFLEYKSEQPKQPETPLATLEIIASVATDDARQGAMAGEVVGRGVLLARDLANQPGNALVPAGLAERAQQLGEKFGIPVTVFGPDELAEQGFGGIIGVGKGSEHPPRFIVIEYGAEHRDGPTICLVGKGITFDTGGISIKPAESMDLMKMDMGGAAAVLGTMQVVAELKLPLHVVGLIGSAENMPGPSAYKPGDVLKTLSGKTVEVINTDAEGRIVLADALFYAQRYEPAAIIDLATLTGAITVALGPHAIG